ncbi:hypothetical protein IWZ03DRAFT_388887 [Phyllosticta citriasiana]|uniref:Uncharacterized protein n=2 Tax=Phyllosticta citriasiana TaxID=595635 RepID=A0ABR1KAQ4_9PEZI
MQHRPAQQQQQQQRAGDAHRTGARRSVQSEWLRWEPVASLELGWWVASSPRVCPLRRRQPCWLATVPARLPASFQLAVEPQLQWILVPVVVTLLFAPRRGRIIRSSAPWRLIPSSPSASPPIGESLLDIGSLLNAFCCSPDATSRLFPILCSMSVRFQQP